MDRKGKTEPLRAHEVCPVCSELVSTKWVCDGCGARVCCKCSFKHECAEIKKEQVKE